MEKHKITEIIIPEDKDTICRFCLNIPEKLISIDEMKWSDLVNISLKEIFKTLRIEVEDVDYLPKKICIECRNKLEDFFLFLEKADTNQELLRSVYLDDTFSSSSRETSPLRKNEDSIEKMITNDHAYVKIMVTEDDNTLHYESDENNTEETIFEKSIPNSFEHFGSETEETIINGDLRSSPQPSTSREFREIDTKFRNHSTSNVVKVQVGRKKSSNNTMRRKFTTKTKKRTITVRKTVNSIPKEPEIISIKQCSLCLKKFSSDGLRIIHYINHVVEATEGMVTHRPFCTYCGLLTSNKEDLDEHLTSKHLNDDELHCHQCEIKFSNVAEIIAHGEKNHEECFEEDDSTIIKCPICGKLFEDIDLVIKHSLTHISRRYTCITCKKIFICDAALNEHHKDHPKYKFKCPICNRLSSNKHALEYHVATHTTSRNFECDVCGRRYKTKNHLIYHRGGHFRPNLICVYCAYSTPSSKDFTMHMRIHSDERPFECTFDNCTKAFKTNSALSAHVKQHLNIKDFQCDVCDYRTSRSVGLALHKRKHTGERPYVCEICSKTFNRKWNLSIHMKKLHNVTIANE